MVVRKYIESLSVKAIVLWSIFTSELLYFLAVQAFDIDRPIFGYYISFVIPLAISYPVSKAIIKRKKELASLNEHNEMLIAILTHDLRAPLTSVHSAIEILKDKETPQDFKEDLLKGLESQTAETLKMIDNVINWGKVYSKEGEWEFEDFDVFEACSNVLRLYKEEASRREVTLENGLKPGLIKVHSQRDMVEGILRNLMNNSLRHTGNGGRITIHSDRPNTVTLTDTGEGMSEAEAKRLMERAKNGMKSGSRVTGVGFALIYYFLREAKIDLQIESKVGEGTSVTLTFDQD